MIFNPRIALKAIETSRRAYTEWSVRNPLTDARFLVIESETEIFVAGSGSKTTKDWVHDAEFRIGRNGIHVGFDSDYCSVETDLENYLASMSLSALKKPVYCGGHSLGGAMAVRHAHQHPDRVAGIYTFGQPRVGNGQFAADFQSILGARHFRFVNSADIVPRLPFPVWPCWPYRHSGTCIFISADGALIENPHWVEKVESDARAFYRVAHGRTRKSIGKRFADEAGLIFSDHNAALYSNALTDALRPLSEVLTTRRTE